MSDSERDAVLALVRLTLEASGEGGPGLFRGEAGRSELAASVGELALARLIPNAPKMARLALSAGLLQVLDQWHASHEAAQEADDLGERPHSAYWHAIAHRREPDPGNAAYWFRRVGQHPSFEPLAATIRELLDQHDQGDLVARLLPGGRYDPMAFVSFCTDAAREPGSVREQLARRIQTAEMAELLQATAESTRNL